MDIQNIHKKAGWYASYMRDKQARALIECQALKIKQLRELLKTIEIEIELTDYPRQETDQTVLNSIRALIQDQEEIRVSKGGFIWIG